MQIGLTVEYRVDTVNTGEGIVSSYQPDTGRVTVIDVDDGAQFAGYEDDTMEKGDHYLTLTLRDEPAHALPTDDCLLGSHGKEGGEVVAVVG